MPRPGEKRGAFRGGGRGKLCKRKAGDLLKRFLLFRKSSKKGRM